MTESMIVEAVKAAGGPEWAAGVGMGAHSPQSVPDPSSVAKFQAAMGADRAEAVSAIPFASQAAGAWRMAEANNQGILHRIRALSELGKLHGPSSADLVELQYEVMNLSFQQEVVTKVADKASNAVQTLIKNQ